MLNCRAVGLKWWVSGDSFSWWFFILQKICSWFGLLRLASGLYSVIFSASPAKCIKCISNVKLYRYNQIHIESKFKGKYILDVQHPHATGSPCCSSLVAGRIQSYAWRTASWRHGWGLFFLRCLDGCIQLSMLVGSLLWDICFRSIGTRRRIYYYCIAILFGPVACGWLVPVAKMKWPDHLHPAPLQAFQSRVSGYGFIWKHTVSTRTLIT